MKACTALLAAVTAVAVSACQPVTQNNAEIGDMVKLHDKDAILCAGDVGAGRLFVQPDLIYSELASSCGRAPRDVRYIITKKQPWSGEVRRIIAGKPWTTSGVTLYGLFPENGTQRWWIVVSDKDATFEDVRPAPRPPTLTRVN